MTDAKYLRGDYRWILGSREALKLSIVALMAVVLFVPGLCLAASFDCVKAVSEAEKIIRGNDELSKLDESLNKAYLEALKRADITF